MDFLSTSSSSSTCVSFCPFISSPFIRVPTVARIHAKLNAGLHTVREASHFYSRVFHDSWTRCAMQQPFTSFNTFLFNFYVIFFPFFFLCPSCDHDGDPFYGETRCARLEFNCFFFRYSVEGLCTITVRVQMYTWNWRYEDFSSRPRPDYQRTANGELRIAEKKRNAKFYNVNLQIGQITSRYKNISHFFFFGWCCLLSPQRAQLVHSSCAMKLSAQHNLIEIIKCKCCPEWTK